MRLPDLIKPLSPEGLLTCGFGLAILLGTLLLVMPFATQPDCPSLSLVDALFMSSSAVCVTGLSVMNTATLSGFGQVSLILLVQLGGLGWMSFAALAYEFLGKRLSLRAQALLQDSAFQASTPEFKGQFHRILAFVGISELIGVIVFFCVFCPQMSVGKALWYSVFHAISAFCNAGFTLQGDSLISWHSSPVILTTVMTLVVLGSLGHPVVIQLAQLVNRYFPWNRKKEMPRIKLELNTRVVLVGTLVLQLIGIIAFPIFGLDTSDSIPSQSTVMGRFWDGAFHSITSRTAGFQSIDLSHMPMPSLLLFIALMFVGGAPSSCAGGVKITTMTLFVSNINARLRGTGQTVIWGRQLPERLIERALLIMAIGCIWAILGFFVLSCTETLPIQDLMFEHISALSTVGLSTGITPELSTLGKVWITITMFLGRVGPLTLVAWAIKAKPTPVRAPEGRLLLG